MHRHYAEFIELTLTRLVELHWLVDDTTRDHICKQTLLSSLSSSSLSYFLLRISYSFFFYFATTLIFLRGKARDRLQTLERYAESSQFAF